MVRSGTPEPAGADQTLGDLVSLAAKDVSQLIRYEIDLAKTELRGDVRRVGLAAALGGIALFVGCLVLVLCCIAFAYGLVALGIWTWAAFLIVAGTCIVLAVGAVAIAWLKVRRISGLSKTRQSVSEGIGMLRREVRDSARHSAPDSAQVGGGPADSTQAGSTPAVADSTAADGSAAVADGRRPGITGPEPR
jgi:uncharacterized membrane protein YqjE